MKFEWKILKRPLSQTIGLGLVFLFTLWLSAATPLSLDDYAWKSDVGIERLKNWFYDYNGRYLSNILEIILTRSYLLQIIVMTCFSTFLIVMMKRLTFKQAGGLSYILILLLVLMLPMIVFAETFGWVAGYVNYVTSAGLMLYIISVMFNQYHRTKLQPLHQILYFVIGLVSALFVEHVTVYLVLLTFCANIYYFVKKRSINLVYFNFFISTLIGAVIMLSNHAYKKISKGNDPYRSVQQHHTLLDNITHLYFYNITQFFFTANLLIVILLFIIVSYVTFLKKLENIKLNAGFCVLLAISILFIFFNQTNLMRVIINPTMTVIAGILFLGVIVMLPIFIWKNFKEDNLRFRLLFYDISAVILTLPFFVVTPYSARCAFASQILFLLIILELIHHLLPNLKFVFPSSLAKAIAAIVLITLSLSYLVPMSVNKYVDAARSDKVMHMKHYPKVLKMQKVPYPEFHTQINFTPNAWMEPAYREIHHIPKTTHIIFEN